VGEPSAGRLVSLHNLAWLFSLMQQAREAVLAGRLAELRREIGATWSVGAAPNDD
jgi:queuine tRNA-ribosyltransferase